MTVFFKALLYFALIDYFSTTLSVSREEEVPFKHFYAFDSTTISLFSDVMKGVGRNPKGEGKKKGGIESPHDDRRPFRYSKIRPYQWSQDAR